MSTIRISSILFLLIINFLKTYSQIREQRAVSFQSPIVSVSAHIYQIASACKDGSINHWNSEIYHTNKNSVIAYSPTGSYIACGLHSGKIYLFSDEGKIKKTLKKHSGPITSLDFSANGQKIISA